MKKLNIIYEDRHLIVVYKPTGMLSISKDNKDRYNLYDKVMDYLKAKNPNNKVFIVHRLDRDTCGLVMFAKSEYIKKKLQNNWQDVVREYYAVVEGPMSGKGHLEDYLFQNKSMYVYVTHFLKGTLAITDYKVLKSNKKYSLLNVDIKTGRKNQIRVQLANINHPIVGDTKYGNSKAKKLCLQAYRLKFNHPASNKEMNLEIKMDKEFQKYIN